MALGLAGIISAIVSDGPIGSTATSFRGTGEWMHKILLISDGHGEDWVAAQIALQLRRLYDRHLYGSVALMALPMVGDGHSYERINVPIALTTRVLPSGGFTFKSMRGLWLDLRSGLTGYSTHLVRSVQTMANWADLVLAVGDILPLGLAWMTRKPYVFIGCTKSDYYTEGAYSCYFPWERALLQPPRCLHTFTRDLVTCKNLRAHQVSASYCGNPMMDGLEVADSVPDSEETLIGLLPGSRPDEAQRNLSDILLCLSAIHQGSGRPVRFEAAISAGLELDAFHRLAQAAGWKSFGSDRLGLGETVVHLHRGNFNRILHRSHLLIAMAGTATEQAVGLGKPVVTLPGQGPQFTRRFAYLQRQLLGESIFVVDEPPDCRPAAVAQTVLALLDDEPRLWNIRRSGRERMGEAGAARQIAEFVVSKLPQPVRGKPRSRS